MKNNKLMGFLFNEPDEQDDGFYQQEPEPARAPEPVEDIIDPLPSRRSAPGNVVKMTQPAPSGLTGVMGSGAAMKMILFQPLNFEDSQAIVDNLRAKKPVIVNMVDLDRETTQRVVDFIGGASYATGGTLKKVSFGIYVIAPSNVSVVGNGEEEDSKDSYRP